MDLSTGCFTKLQDVQNCCISTHTLDFFTLGIVNFIITLLYEDVILYITVYDKLRKDNIKLLNRFKLSKFNCEFFDYVSQKYYYIQPIKLISERITIVIEKDYLIYSNSWEIKTFCEDI